MFQNITFFMIGPFPLIVYGGFATAFCFITAALMPYLGQKGIVKNHFLVHRILAITGLILGLIHAVFGILSYL